MPKVRAKQDPKHTRPTKRQKNNLGVCIPGSEFYMLDVSTVVANIQNLLSPDNMNIETVFRELIDNPKYLKALTAESKESKSLRMKLRSTLSENDPTEADTVKNINLNYLPEHLTDISFTKEDVMAHYIVLVTFAFLLSLIDLENLNKINMTTDWKRSVFVTITYLLRCPSPLIDVCSEVPEDQFEARIREITNEATSILGMSSEIQTCINSYIIDVTTSMFELQSMFLTRLRSLVGYGLSSFMMCIGSWKKIVSSPVVGLMGKHPCKATGELHGVENLTYLTTISYTGVQETVTIRTELVNYIKVAHFYLNMGYILTQSTHHFYLNLDYWAKTVNELLFDCTDSYMGGFYNEICRTRSSREIAKFLI